MAQWIVLAAVRQWWAQVHHILTPTMTQWLSTAATSDCCSLASLNITSSQQSLCRHPPGPLSLSDSSFYVTRTWLHCNVLSQLSMAQRATEWKPRSTHCHTGDNQMSVYCHTSDNQLSQSTVTQVTMNCHSQLSHKWQSTVTINCHNQLSQSTVAINCQTSVMRWQ